MKLDLQVVRGTPPRQNQHRQCRPVMLDLLGPEQVARPVSKTADAKSVAEARPRGIVRLGVYFRAWTRVNFAHAEGTREVWWCGDATETALTVESGRCRSIVF